MKGFGACLGLVNDRVRGTLSTPCWEEDCLIGDGLLTYSMAEFMSFPHVYLFLLQHEFIPSSRQNLEEELCLRGPVTYQVTVQE